jgi:Rieske Fe-S protein
MERRKFIKSTCNLCLLAGAGYFLSELTACSPAFHVMNTEVVNNEIQVPLTSFTQNSFQIIHPKGRLYDIALQKKADNSYHALLMRCTHQDNQLTAASNGFACSLHGSQFNREGEVTKGPAERPLKQLATSINQDKIIIHL